MIFNASIAAVQTTPLTPPLTVNSQQVSVNFGSQIITNPKLDPDTFLNTVGCPSDATSNSVTCSGGVLGNLVGYTSNPLYAFVVAFGNAILGILYFFANMIIAPYVVYNWLIQYGGSSITAWALIIFAGYVGTLIFAVLHLLTGRDIVF